jgi:hypothetical protein
MTNQLVSLFDRDKYGLNVLAGIGLFAGSMLNWCFGAVQQVYDVLVHEARFFVGDEPITLADSLVSGVLRTGAFALVASLGVVVFCHIFRRDLLLPIVMGVLLVLFEVAARATGFYPGGELNARLVLLSFANNLLYWTAVILCFRVLENKLEGIFVGFVLGGMAGVALVTVQWSIPVSYFPEMAVREVFVGFITGVFFYAGISYHLVRRGIAFGEYGFVTERASLLEEPGTQGEMLPEGAAAAHVTPSERLGKTRRPLVTVVLMLITLNLYTFGWIYKVYREIRERSARATEVTPGKALGFLLIPLFNFFWSIWLFFDLPRAIKRMELADPPGGVPPQRWCITSLWVLSIPVGLIGGYIWRWALLLNAVLIWSAVLIAQSALNSHWRAHQASRSFQKAASSPGNAN